MDRLETYHSRALAPHWARVRTLLEAEVHHRAQRLAEAGPAGLFASLHPTVQWHDDRLVVDLHAAGVLTPRREGRTVLYRRTPMGDALCDDSAS